MLHTPATEPYRAPFDVLPGKPGNRLLILCDHATNALPPAYGTLGLADSEFRRHIAYDIGARWVTHALSEKLGAPAILSGFSRLLIDPNRGPDDPTLVMRLSDGAVIPGNGRIDEAEVVERTRLYHEPYHAEIKRQIDAMLGAGDVPVILSVHSFTPNWKTVARRWHAALLWDKDPRFARLLIDALEADGDLVVGDNEPYDGALERDTLYTHGTVRGLPHALIEIRQDLISEETQAIAWAERLARIIPPMLDGPALSQIEYWGSRAHDGRRAPPVPADKEQR
jgi:predicted N-formylglutamate amidohydrolase